MATRVVIEASIRQFRDGCFTCAILRKRFAGLPGLPSVVAKNGIGKMSRPETFGPIPLSVEPGGTNQATFVFTVLQCDPMFIHMHGRHAPLAVWTNRDRIGSPSLAIILATINREGRWWMLIFHKDENIARRFIDSGPTAVNSRLGDGDVVSPRLATVLTSLSTNI